MTLRRIGLIAAILAVPACAAAPPAFAPDPEAAEVVIPGDPYLSRVATRWFRDGDETRLVKLEAAAAEAVSICSRPGWRLYSTLEGCHRLRALDLTVRAIRAAQSAQEFNRWFEDRPEKPTSMRMLESSTSYALLEDAHKSRQDAEHVSWWLERMIEQHRPDGQFVFWHPVHDELNIGDTGEPLFIREAADAMVEQANGEPVMLWNAARLRDKAAYMLGEPLPYGVFGDCGDGDWRPAFEIDQRELSERRKSMALPPYEDQLAEVREACAETQND